MARLKCTMGQSPDYIIYVCGENLKAGWMFIREVNPVPIPALVLCHFCSLQISANEVRGYLSAYEYSPQVRSTQCYQAYIF